MGFWGLGFGVMAVMYGVPNDRIIGVCHLNGEQGLGAVHFRNHAGISGTMIQELGRVISGTRMGHFRNQDRSFQEPG